MDAVRLWYGPIDFDFAESIAFGAQPNGEHYEKNTARKRH